jgi:hypothetical protein
MTVELSIKSIKPISNPSGILEYAEENFLQMQIPYDLELIYKISNAVAQEIINHYNKSE